MSDPGIARGGTAAFLGGTLSTDAFTAAVDQTMRDELTGASA